MGIILGLDIGSNSVGSAWIERQTGRVTAGVSVFPAGVEESDEKRGDPKNAKRRMTRRTRITLARRADRKRELRLKLIEAGLLPASEAEFKRLMEDTDPWELRRRGLDEPLKPIEFGRVLLHLAQRRGASGLRVLDSDEAAKGEATTDDGKVKKAIGEVRTKMLDKKARTFGEFIAMVRAERVTPIASEDKRPANKRKGPREWRDAVRNKAATYEHCADRKMIRCEFAELWRRQRELGGEIARLLTDALRLALDDESGDAIWRHKGLLFGQRKATWDLGTLGRCVLHPEERCVPHADMYASRYLVVETVNNLKIIERGQTARPLTTTERDKIKNYLNGPLGLETSGKRKGQPKHTVNVTDLRNLMGWGRATKTTAFRFNIESDEDRAINTDWFSREIIHGAVTVEKWEAMSERTREGLNRAILKFDPDHEEDEQKLKKGVMDWAGLTSSQADALVTAWKSRPKPDAKRLSMSRRAVRNLLPVMDRPEPRPDAQSPAGYRWLTQIEARKAIAADVDFVDAADGKPFDASTRGRYAIGAKGATARDRYYMKKHLLRKNGEPIYDSEGLPLREPPPAPLISNPVVRKAIHEVRRHLIEYMRVFGRKPDEVCIELAREARMGKQDADRLLFRNRLRNRIRNEIIRDFHLDSRTATQQREAVKRVVLAVQQDCICPLCGKRMFVGECDGLTLLNAANGEGCQIAHIIPRASCDNSYNNIVLAHTKCNHEMGRRTPRDYWNATLPGEFEEGLAWIEAIYGDIQRIKPSETKKTTGPELWKCYFTEQARPKRGSMTDKPPNYFTRRMDKQKLEQFKKDVKDNQEMTPRQEAATKYAARQVMAYLADALYDGTGLPERGGQRRIFATDGLWTSRFRREWGLFFDPHDARSHGLPDEERSQRREKDRGDHRHHAIDAILIAYCSSQMQKAWKDREERADRDGINTADEEAMDNYRRSHPLAPPAPFKSREEFRQAVKRAVFGDEQNAKPVCHRPVKRKLIGALHKASQYGPVLDFWVQGGVVHREPVDGRVTIRQNVLGKDKEDYLKPAHLRMPRPETNAEAIERLARRYRIGKHGMSKQDAIKAARKFVKSKAFTRKLVDPKPEKGGIVRDSALRRRLRMQLQERNINPDSYSKVDLKRSIDKDGPLTQASGVPIRRVILLWSNNDPVLIHRDHFDYRTGDHDKLDDPVTYRLYDGQNNHHVEIRVDAKGKWTGKVVTAFEVAERLRKRWEALALLTKPYNHLRRKPPKDLGLGLPKEDRSRLRSARARENLVEWKRHMRELNAERSHIILEYPQVDRSDNNNGSFVMSLCEGEILWMRRKPEKRGHPPGDPGYFVVAKISEGEGIVLVPHWDARAATERKDAEGRKVPNSKREQFAVTPTDLQSLAPPGCEHALKVRVTPLGEVIRLEKD